MIRKCELCEFWKAEESGQESGECRRNAPAISHGQGQASWPMTQDREWCGDFRYDQHQEQKIPRQCKFCEFWETEGFNQGNGECRHGTPRTCHEQNQRAWLMTQGEDWCGEFRARSGKLVGTTKCPV